MRNHTIAVFGSAFNPPHRGHEDVIVQAAQKADSVLLVPSYCHAFGKQMAPYNIRFRMAEAMVSDMAQSVPIQVSDIERKLSAQGEPSQPVYTYDVLNAVQSDFPDAAITFVLGPDNADPATWQRFYRAQDILDRWGIFVAQERIPIRSTLIRNKLAEGIDPSGLEVSPSVIKFIKGLYPLPQGEAINEEC